MRYDEIERRSRPFMSLAKSESYLPPVDGDDSELRRPTTSIRRVGKGLIQRRSIPLDDSGGIFCPR